jgi:hypothetical protein
VDTALMPGGVTEAARHCHSARNRELRQHARCADAFSQGELFRSGGCGSTRRRAHGTNECDGREDSLPNARDICRARIQPAPRQLEQLVLPPLIYRHVDLP